MFFVLIFMMIGVMFLYFLFMMLNVYWRVFNSKKAIRSMSIDLPENKVEIIWVDDAGKTSLKSK